jgi:hypothetical protein
MPTGAGGGNGDDDDDDDDDGSGSEDAHLGECDASTGQRIAGDGVSAESVTTACETERTWVMMQHHVVPTTSIPPTPPRASGGMAVAYLLCEQRREWKRMKESEHEESEHCPH